MGEKAKSDSEVKTAANLIRQLEVSQKVFYLGVVLTPKA